MVLPDANVLLALAHDERFTFVPEPLGLEHMWRRLTMVSAFSPKVWNDRYLAAFALTSSLLTAVTTRFRRLM